MHEAPRVFVSYSHESDAHRERVLALADRLRRDGVDARLDRYEGNPSQGWPRWMMEQVANAAFILAVCTPTYRERFEGRAPPGQGRGVNFEGLLATQVLYDADGRGDRLVPVLLPGGDQDHVPLPLRPFTIYTVEGDYRALLDRIFGRDRVLAPPIGDAPEPTDAPMPPLAARTERLPNVARAEDAWWALDRMLVDLYEPWEIRRWVAYLDQELLSDLPGDSAPPSRFVFELTQAIRRRALLSRGFFSQREVERPNRAGTIRAVEALFVAVGVIPPAAPVAPPADQSPTTLTAGVPASTPAIRGDGSARAAPTRPVTVTHLDRVAQWGDLRNRLRSKRPQVFFVHGGADQGLRHFLERVERYVKESDELHGEGPAVDVIRVSTALSLGGLNSQCDTVPAWLERFVQRLAPTGGTFAEALRVRTSSAPVLLLLGPAPFCEGRVTTPAAVFDAFLEALDVHYAGALRGLPNPVHLLFCVEDGPARAWAARAYEVLGAHHQRGTWGFNPVRAQVGYPPWADIDEYITVFLRLHIPDAGWWARLRVAHAECDPHYVKFAEVLHDLLEEHWPTS